MKIGYARVSTQGQTLDAQVEQLGRAGCSTIYREVASGARSDRVRLRALLAGLKPGTTIVVTRLDRLARSTVDLLNIIKTGTGEGRERAKRAGIKMGRKPKLNAHQAAEVRGRKIAGESVRQLARS